MAKKNFSSYSTDKQAKAVELSKGFATSVQNTKQRANDPNLPEAVRESAKRQLVSLEARQMTAYVLDDFSNSDIFKVAAERDDVMQVRNNPNLLQKGPDSSPQLILLINLKQVIRDYDDPVTSNVADGYSGVPYPDGLDGIIKKYMHEMRHMDPRNIVQKNTDSNSQNRWIYRLTKERDADKWANEEWSALDDLSDRAFQP